MWILLNNKSVNVFDILIVSEVTTIPREDLLKRLDHDCEYDSDDESSLIVAMEAFHKSAFYNDSYKWLYDDGFDYGSFISLMKKRWEEFKTIFPESISWFSITLKCPTITHTYDVYSKIYPSESAATVSRDNLLKTINQILSGLPKVNI